MKYLLLSLIFISTAIAQEPASPEAQLREQLRNTALQLRAAEVEKANALATFAAEQAKNETLQKEIDDLNTRLATLTKRASEDKVASEQAITKLNDQLALRDQRLKEFSEALEKWKAAQQQTARIAQQKESERATLANQNAVLKNTIADRERKNLTLYNTALEILDRYQNYSLGRALGAREPFIQKTRVAIETQVEGYKSTIIDNRLKAKP